MLRFNTKQVREQAATYCVSTVFQAINKLGGIVPRAIDPDAGIYQPSLFDWQALEVLNSLFLLESVCNSGEV